MFQQPAPRHGFTDPHMEPLVARFFAPEIAAWRGQQPLWKVFWVYGVSVSCALIAIYLLAFLSGQVALRQVFVFCFAPYTAWILVAIWRCAGNSRELYWGMVARFLTVAWAVNTVLIVLFVEMNLITHYYLSY